MSLTAPAECARDPGRERRDERDEREADHQRRRRSRPCAADFAGSSRLRRGSSCGRAARRGTRSATRAPTRSARPAHPHDEDDKRQQRVQHAARNTEQDAPLRRSPARRLPWRSSQNGKVQNGQTRIDRTTTAQVPIGLTTVASGRTMRDEKSATPMKTSIAPTPSEEQHRARPVRPEQRPRAEREAQRDEHQRARRRGTARSASSGSVAPSRTAAIGGTRVARIAGRRLASSVTRMPTSSEMTIVRVSKISPWFGSVKPTASNSLKSPLASPRPENRPIDRRERADDERLDHDRDEHLPARGAERPDRRELARPLGDRDRERVRDHEAADEERDPAKTSRKIRKNADELVRVRGVVLGLLRRELDLGGGRQDLLDLLDELVSETPGAAATAISSSLPCFSKIRCAVGRSNPASVAPPIVETEPNLTTPEMRSRSTGPSPCTADHLADREVLLVGRRLVDHDLARPRPRRLRRA